MRAPLLGLLVASLLGCDPRIRLGELPPGTVTADEAGVDPPAFPWFARHETGDLSEWYQGSAGGDFSEGITSTEVTGDIAHGGSRAVRMTIVTGDGLQHGARLYRTGLPREAYYGAWLYLDGDYAVPEWWNLVNFRGRAAEDQPDTGIALWSLNGITDSDGALSLRLMRHSDEAVFRPQVPAALPPRQWAHLETYFRVASDGSGRITVWLDGREVLDFEGATAPNGYLYWGVGSRAAEIDPPTATVFIDDASVSPEPIH